MRPCLSLLVGALAVPVAAEDLTIVSKVAREGAPPQTTTSYYSAGKVRASQGEQEFVADLASGQITVIDHKKKEYSVITRQEMDAAAARVQAQMKQMEQQMQGLPPAMREKMQGLMGGGAVAQAISVQKGTGGRKVAGYSCENWIVSFGEISRSEECLTTELSFPVAAWDAWKGFSSAMAGMAGPAGKNTSALYDKFKEMKGFPLASRSTTTILGRTMTSTTEVAEVRKGAIPASAWEVPAGYKKVESPLAKMNK